MNDVECVANCKSREVAVEPENKSPGEFWQSLKYEEDCVKDGRVPTITVGL